MSDAFNPLYYNFENDTNCTNRTNHPMHLITTFKIWVVCGFLNHYQGTMIRVGKTSASLISMSMHFIITIQNMYILSVGFHPFCNLKLYRGWGNTLGSTGIF